MRMVCSLLLSLLILLSLLLLIYCVVFWCFGVFLKKFFIKKIGQDGWIELGPLTHAEYDQKNTIHTVKHGGGKNILFIVCLLRAQDDFTTGKKAGP